MENKIKFKKGQQVEYNGEPVTILDISLYKDNKKEIDNSIANTGWESSTNKEDLVWYKIDYEGLVWVDSEELEFFNS